MAPSFHPNRVDCSQKKFPNCGIIRTILLPLRQPSLWGMIAASKQLHKFRYNTAEGFENKSMLPRQTHSISNSSLGAGHNSRLIKIQCQPYVIIGDLAISAMCLKLEDKPEQHTGYGMPTGSVE